MSTEGVFRELPLPAEIAPPLPDQIAIDSVLSQAVQAIYIAIVDSLLLIWYAIQHAIHYLMSGDSWTQERVFEGHLICSSTNFGRFSDLPEYVAIRRNASPTDDRVIEAAKKYGFLYPTSTIPKPYTEGHCFGNVAIFLKTWLETHDIRKTAPLFSEGSPLAGALCQQAYEQYTCQYYLPVSESIQRILEKKSSCEEERPKWLGTPYESGIVILDALQTYLEANSADCMTDFIKKHLSKQSKRLCGQYLASVRHAEEQWSGIDLTERDRMNAAFAFSGLSVESIPHLASSAGDLLRTLETAGPGAYKISFPVYSPTGELAGHHAIGLIISTGICYFLDSNIGVGWSYRDKLVSTVGRLLTEYTGMDYSEDIHGKPPSSLEWAANVIRERANPPKAGARDHVCLIKVKLIEK